MRTIYQKVRELNIEIKCVCEIGVYLPDTSNVIDFWENGIETHLVEAGPETIQKIETFTKNYSNVNIHPVAIWKEKCELEFSRAKASTFASQLEVTPAIVNDKFQVNQNETFKVRATTFDEIDNTRFDLVSIDVEGAEWFVLQGMKSIPKVISIETHGKFYTNPFLEQINEWMQNHNYSLWYKDSSDSIFIRNDIYQISIEDKFLVFLMNLKNGLISLKRFLR